MKNGEGRFLHQDKGQVYSGTWVDDVAKCGVMEDVDRDSAPHSPPYPIPQVSSFMLAVQQHLNNGHGT